MSYSTPLSERIQIQAEIFCENLTDSVSSISSKHKRNILILLVVGVMFTMKNSRKGIRSVKPGIMGTTKVKKPSLLSRLTGKAPKTGIAGSSMSLRQGALGAGGQLGAAGPGQGALGGQLGAAGRPGGLLGGGPGAPAAATGGLRGANTPGFGMGGPPGPPGATMPNTMGGAPGMNTMGGAPSFGGAASTFGAPSALAGGKSTSMLADSNPTSIITLDPSIHFYDYGGMASFSGQIETAQAYDSPNFVSQVLNTPGQNKVLVIDAGGMRPDMGAVFDSNMANAAQRNGWKGVIVHGMIRNVAQLQRTQIGVKALGTSPVKGKQSMGQKSMQLSIGNTQLQPGWWIYADSDGMIISQTDISGGSFGGPAVGAPSMMSQPGGIPPPAFGATNTMGGMQSSFGQNTMPQSSFGQPNMMGNTMGNTMGGMQNNMQQRNTLGGPPGATGGIGTTPGGLGGATPGQSMLGGYPSTLGGGSKLAGGYGGAALGANSAFSGKRSSFSSYSNIGKQKRKRKMFKMLLASSIAAIVWLVVLR